MNKQFKWLFVLIALLGLVGLACNAITGGDNDGSGNAGSGASSGSGDNSGSGSEASDAAAGSDAVVEGPQTLDLTGITAGLADANSYRLRVEMTVQAPEDSGIPPLSMTMETATVVEPPALQSDITIQGDETLAGMGSVQIIQIGDTSYSTLPGVGCVSGSAADLGADLNPFAGLLESGEILGDVSGATRVLPDETINGVETYHFTFDESAITDPNNELESVEGHIFVSKEEGYLVRLVMDGVGQIDLMGTGQPQQGNLHVEVNTSDVNQPIEILPPENCTSFDFEIPDLGLDTDAAASPYPVMESAQQLFILNDIVNYQTDEPLSDVVAFYQAEMPAAGFTADTTNTFISDTVATLYFTRDDVTYLVTVSDSEGTIFVIISPQ